MKRPFFRKIAAAALALTVFAGYTAVVPSGLTTGITAYAEATEITIGNGTGTTYYTPFNSLWGYSMVQSIYTASEIGTAGTINSISYEMSSSDSFSTAVDIYMKNVDKSEFSGNTDYFELTSSDLVCQTTWTIQQGWNTIDLDTPFAYDGTSNLLICFHEKTPGYSTRRFMCSSVPYSVLSYHSDTYDPDMNDLSAYPGTKYTQNDRANIKLFITPTVKATAVNLDKTTATLTVGDTDSLIATVLPDDTYDRTVTWSSSDDTVVSVTDLGNGFCSINALGEGTATITATATNGTPDTADDITATCVVTVAATATAVNLDKATATLTVGDTDSLTATVLPADAADKTVTWSSSDDAVVSVTDLGNGSCNINALGEGTATITATATNGTPDTADDITATCTVTVEAPVPPEPTHTWGGTSYEWSLNNGIVVATYRCIDDPSLTIKETAYTTSEVTKQPTATTWGETTYTAVFTDPVFTTQRKAVQDIRPVAPAPAPAPVYPDYDPYFVPSYTPAGGAPVFASPAPYHSPIEGKHIRSRYDGKGNIILSWDAVDIADDYIVYLIQNGKAKKLTTTDDLSYTYTGAKAGTSYTFMVKYHVGSSVSRASESYRTTVKTAGKKPVVTAAVNDGYILLTWGKVTNAEGYAVYQQNENGRLKKLGTTTDTSFRVDTVPGETYTFAVKAYVDGEWTTVNKSDLVYVMAE